MSLGVTAVGGRRSAVGGRRAACGVRRGDAGNSYSLPGYARLDAVAAYTQRFGQQRLTAQLNVNNLLDKRYYANSDCSSLDAIPGYPVSLMGSLKYEF